MRFCITVDEKTKEFVEKFSKIVGYSESCIYSFGVWLITHYLRASDETLDLMFEQFYDYAENYYKVKNKQGGARNEKKTLSTSS